MSDTPPLFGQLLVGMGLASEQQLAEALALQALTGQRVGESLVSLGYVTPEALREALLQALGIAEPEGLERPRIGDLLVRLKHVTVAARDEALTRQRQDGRRLGEILVELGHCSFREVYEALSLQQPRTAHRVSEPAPPPPDGKRRILVVDDSPLACALIKRGLSELGYDVHTFEDPFLALEQVAYLSPDLVVTDLNMPGLDGTELCRRLKESPTRVPPVIILTAGDEERQRVLGLKAGADDCVQKAASTEELAARIESILRRTQETERMRQLFARYTSDAVVDEALRAGGLVLTGEKREVTVLFADLRNFTAISETLPPEDVVSILNDVLALLSDAVMTCMGTLDKFLGDGVMAVFGAPVRRPDDALRAVQAGQMMMTGLERLRERAYATLQPSPRTATLAALQLGVGINSGMVVAGNLGSALRTEYTVIGDPVNVASRLCALAGPGEILVGHRTRELAATSAKFQPLNPVVLKGKSRPVPLFRALWS